MKTKIVISIIFTAVWFLLSVYFFKPTIALSASWGIYVNLTVYFAILGFISLLKTGYSYKNNFVVPTIFFGAAAILFIVLIGISFFNSSLFRASSYQTLIGEVEISEFNAYVQPIPTDQMLIVDDEIAKRVGEKLLGSDPGLGSRAKIGKFVLQPVAGKLYWIAPLVHSGFFKWNRFRNEGTPGYVRVSATNQEDYALITKDSDGNDLRIRYQPNSFFKQDLSRYIYLNGYLSVLYTDLTFEVDDNWNPYWTVTIYDSKIGFSGNEATGLITIDPESGHIEEYTVEKAPLWSERIQPASFVKNQIRNWGELIHGWWNPSNRDKLGVTDNYSLVMGDDNKSYFYYGLTSKGKEESTVGFIMVDSKTKKAHWFKQVGATEFAAQKSAQGKFPEKGYKPSEGIIYNISGHSTYEFILKDSAGLMKMIALVNVYDHTIVGIGESRQEAVRDYETQMNDRGNAVAINKTEMEIEKITSTIKRFGSENMKGTTYYYFILSDNPKTMFFATSRISVDLTLTKEGDKVTIQYILGTSKTVSIMKFENLTLGVVNNEEKIIKNSIDSIKISKVKIANEKVVDQKWNELSADEKKELMTN